MYWILFDFPLRNSQCHCCGTSGELRGGYHSGTVKAIVEMAPRLRVWGCVPFLCPHCYTGYAESDRSLTVLGGEKQVETGSRGWGITASLEKGVAVHTSYLQFPGSFTVSGGMQRGYYSSHGDPRPLHPNSLWFGLLVSVL